jgi:hypothetical protein
MTDILRDLLERAQNGLRWYQDALPGAASEADDELHAEIDAALQAYTSGQEPLGYAVFWGIGEMRPHPHMFESVESAEAYAKQIKSVTEVRPVYCHPLQPLSDVQAFKAYTQGTGMQLPNLGKLRSELLTLVRAVEAAHNIGEKK